MEVLLILVVVWLVFGVLGAWVANQKGRSGEEGFMLGVLFGPLGVLIEALLPAVAPPSPTLKNAEQAAERAAVEEAARIARRAAFNAKVAVAWRWFDRWVVRFGWYRALPELPRLIVLGLGCAAPVVAVFVWLFGG